MMSLQRRTDLIPEQAPSSQNPPKSAWDYYNDDIRIVEAEREKEWDENMNAILVVASLFAAFLSAFLVETTKLLREDSNESLKMAVIHLSAQYNNSAIGSFEISPFQASTNDVVVNSLLLTSLALNLVAVVVAMLVKQWNREFDRGLRLITDPKDHALRQEFRILGSDYWRLPDIVTFVPILVLLSVLFFIVGFFLYLLSLHTTPAFVFVLISGTTLLFYIMTLLISIIDCKSPFRSAASRLVYYLYARLRFRWGSQNGRKRKEHPIFAQVNEEREKRHVGHESVIMAALQRLSDKAQVTPRNRHKFYSIAQELSLSSPKDADAEESAKHKAWTTFLAKIDSKLTNEDGEGLWFMAAEKVDEITLKALQRISGIGSRDKSGRTPLHVAAHKGHEEVVRLLLAQDGVEVNARDSRYGQTPLSWAAKMGHDALVRLLLAKEGIDCNSTDNGGQTPLSWAASNGHEAVVRLISAKEGVYADAKDNSGQTPLLLAVKKGHEAVVRLLLAQEDVDVNAKDPVYGRTPLSWAAEKGYDGVLRLLLAKESADFNAKDDGGRTSLLWAATMGHDAVVHLLLAKEGVDANAKDNGGQTPLSLAIKKGHEAVVRLLLAQEGVDVNAKDPRHGRTPLSWAAAMGLDTMVRLLLAREGVDADSMDDNGRTPLSWAASNGHDAIIRLLLMQDGINADHKDVGGQTPLSWAAANGHEAVVRLLLAQAGVGAESKDNAGGTPFLWASKNGHEMVVQLLRSARATTAC